MTEMTCKQWIVDWSLSFRPNFDLKRNWAIECWIRVRNLTSKYKIHGKPMKESPIVDSNINPMLNNSNRRWIGTLNHGVQLIAIFSKQKREISSIKFDIENKAVVCDFKNYLINNPLEMKSQKHYNEKQSCAKYSLVNEKTVPILRNDACNWVELNK